MNEFPMHPKKRRKVDHAALQSPLSRIPGMVLPAVRDLLDLGIGEVDELRGRDPRVLLDAIRRIRPETPQDRIGYFRLATYYAETPEPDPRKLQAHVWMDETHF
jgi:hypothetical protein